MANSTDSVNGSNPHEDEAPPGAEELVQQIISEVFSYDVPAGEEVSYLRRQLAELDEQRLGEQLPLVQQAIASLREFFAGQDMFRTGEDPARARAYFARAVDGFAVLGRDDLVLRAKVNLALAAGFEASQANDIEGARRHLNEAEGLLRDASDFDEGAIMQLDHMRSDTLFLEALRRMMNLDLQGAELVATQASHAARKVAEKYYDVDSEPYKVFLGQSYFILAYYDLAYSFSEFNKFNYDALVSQTNIAADATRARELLLGLDSPLITRLAHASSVIEQLLPVLQELSRIMQGILKANLAVEGTSFAEMRQRIRNGRDDAAKIGDQGLALLRICDHMTSLINNLERLLRPTTKDFGRFAGLAACVTFAVLFLAVSVVDYVFGVGLDASQVVAACLLLAIIGGFGYGALRFKELLGLVAAGSPAAAVPSDRLPS